MLRVGEAVRRAFAEVVFDAPDGHVHRRQFPGGAVFFLAVDGDGAGVALVGADEALGLDEEAAAAHRRVIDAAVVGLQHGDDEANDGFGGEVLAAAFAFGEGKAAEEVFVNVAEDVFGAERAVGVEAVFGKELDETDEGGVADAVVADALEDAFEAGVVFFDGVEGVVDEFGDAAVSAAPGEFGAGFEGGDGGDFVPARLSWYPEDGVFGVVVAFFEFGGDSGGVIGGAVVVGGGEVVGACRVFEVGGDALLLGAEAVADVFEEDEAEDDVFVVGGVQLGAKFVGGFPQVGFEAAEEGLGFGV